MGAERCEVRISLYLVPTRTSRRGGDFSEVLNLGIRTEVRDLQRIVLGWAGVYSPVVNK